jgi:hypothetical protein
MIKHLIQPVFGYASDAATNAADRLNLCVEYGEHYLTLSVYTADKSPVSIETYVLKEGLDVYTLEYILQMDHYSAKSFDEVSLIVNTPDVSLIPEKFHKDHLSQTIYNTLHGDLQVVDVLTDHLSQWELDAVYGVDKSISNYLTHQYPSLKTKHFISLALISLFRNNLEDLDSFIKIYFSQSYMTVILVKGAQLQFAQSIYYETTEDAVYQLLNLVARHHMDLKQLKAQVSGHIDEDSATWKELRKYLLDISLEPSLSIQNESSDRNTVGSHFFTPHLQVLQCV